MFCKNCGNELNEKAFCCPNCGFLVNKNYNPTPIKTKNQFIWERIEKIFNIIGTSLNLYTIMFLFAALGDWFVYMTTDYYGVVQSLTAWPDAVPIDVSIIFSILSLSINSATFVLNIINIKKLNITINMYNIFMFALSTTLLVTSIILDNSYIYIIL